MTSEVMPVAVVVDRGAGVTDADVVRVVESIKAPPIPRILLAVDRVGDSLVYMAANTDGRVFAQGEIKCQPVH